MKTFRSVEYWETEWTIGTRYDGYPGEEEFTPVYSGNEATKETEIAETGTLCISYVALIPKDIAAQAVFQGTPYHFSLADSILFEPKAISALSRRVMVISGGSPATGQRRRLSGRALVESTVLTAKVFGINENCIFLFRQFGRLGTNSKSNINSKKYHAITD